MIALAVIVSTKRGLAVHVFNKKAYIETIIVRCNTFGIVKAYSSSIAPYPFSDIQI